MSAEQSSQRTEQLLKEAEALTHCGSFEWEIATNRLLWSDELFRIYGYAPGEVQPNFSVFLSHVHPDDRAQVEANVQNAMRSTHAFEQVERIIRRDGSVRYLETRGRVIRDEQGSPLRLLGACADITDRVDNLNRLSASETRFRTFVDHAADSMFLFLHGGKIIDVNRRACEALGYTREELIGSDATLFSIHQSTEGLARITDYLDSTMELTWESIHRRKDGSCFPVEIRLRRFWENGEKRSVAIVRDITSRKKAEESLAASERRMRMVLQSANMVVWEANPTTLQFEFVSEHCDKLLGFSHEEWVQPGFWVRQVHPDDRDEALEIRRHCAESGIGSRMEYRLLTASGQFVWVEDIVQVTVGPDRTKQMSGVLLDVTDRRILNEQLRQSQKMEAIGRLAGGVAHDFNNLLTVMMVNCDLLLSDIATEDERREKVVSIHEAGKRAAALTRQLLTYSRKGVMSPQRLDLNEVLSSMELLMRSSLGEGISLQIHHDSALRPIRVDPAQLDQILFNLVINAKDAMDGKGRLLLETRDKAGPSLSHPQLQLHDFVELVIRDSGTGMSPEILSKIYDPFFTTKEIGRGTGLGLSVVQGVVAGAGGFIDVESELGQGTAFHIYFPAADAGKTISPPPDRTTLQPGMETILLAEDDPGVRFVTKTALAQQGYRVIEAASGHEALQQFLTSSIPVDLVLTDVVMPGMSGRKLAEEVRTRDPNLPVLFMSGHMDNAVIQYGVRHGADAFIQKPFSPHTLGCKLRELLALRDEKKRDRPQHAR